MQEAFDQWPVAVHISFSSTFEVWLLQQRKKVDEFVRRTVFKVALGERFNFLQMCAAKNLNLARTITMLQFTPILARKCT